MRSLQFNVGSVLHFTGAKVATILAVDGETFTVHFKDTGEAKDFRLTELLELYANGELTARPASILGRDENEKKRPALLLSDLSERDRAQVIFKRGLVEAMEKKSRELPLSAVIKEFNPYSGSIEERSVFQHVLNNVSFAAGRNRPVSRPTYYRIKYEYQKYGDIVDLASNRSLCGREKFLHHRARALMVEQFEEMYRLSLAQRKGAVHARHSLARLEGIIQDILDEEGEGVKGPSKATIYREYNNLPSYQRSVIEKGPRAARIEYRTSTGREPPEHCLDYVQYDEAHSDIFVFDEDTGAPIGRAIFCWYICCLSGMPLGFYIGFEPWSDVSTMAALRHSVMPKTYVRTHYPDIDGVWPAFGKPRVVQFDNGLTQHANTIKSALHNLNATPEWGKPYWPVFKSDVENMHRQVNATLLLALPGGVPLEKFRHPDYDPSVCGCIGMRHLLYIMHHWIIRRQINTPKGLLKQTPLQRWRDGTKEYLPCLPSSADDIEILFGVKRSAVLNHNGVVVSNVHFSAPWMADFKRRHSSSGEVQISIGLGTMGYIHVYDPDFGWRQARSRLYDFTSTRTLRQLEAVSKYALANFKETTEPALKAAEKALRELSRFAFESATSLRLRKQVARANSIGSDALMPGLDSNGDIGPAIGAFAGESLNPFHDPPQNLLGRSFDQASGPLPPPEPSVSKPFVKPAGRPLPRLSVDFTRGEARS